MKTILTYCEKFIRAILDTDYIQKIYNRMIQVAYTKQQTVFMCCVFLENITQEDIVFSEHSLRHKLQDPSKPPRAEDFFPNHALSKHAFDRIRQVDNTHPLTRKPLSTCYIYTPDHELISIVRTHYQVPEIDLAELDFLLLGNITFYIPSIVLLIQDAQHSAQQAQNNQNSPTP